MLWRDDEPAARSPEPTRIGRFLIQRELGRGGMGVVYLSSQEDLARPVALKVLPLQSLPGPGAAERFLREAHSGASLRHEHIVQVYEAGRSEGCLYIAMEYIDGESLAARMTRGRLPPAEAGRIGAVVARALDHAHRQGLVHRDVKPANILLDAKGRAVLADFGLARNLSLPSLTVTGELLGTPMYMSPEQAEGRPDLDARSDVFSLGMTLHALLEGRTPYPEATPVARLIGEVQRGETPALSPSVPRDLRLILLKATDRNPARRYATAGEMAEDLERFGRGEPVRARPAGPGLRFVRAIRRNPTLAALTLLLVVAAIAGASTRFRRGYLLIEVEPSDAAVLLDSKELPSAGPTVRRVSLSPGSHLIRFSREGYKPQEHPVSIERGIEIRLKATLERKTGKIVVRTAGDAIVTLTGAGSSRRLTPGAEETVGEGVYGLQVAKPGHHSFRRTITATSDRTSRIDAGLCATGSRALRFPEGCRFASAPAENEQAAVLAVSDPQGVVHALRNENLGSPLFVEEVAPLQSPHDRWSLGRPAAFLEFVDVKGRPHLWAVGDDGRSLMIEWKRKGKIAWTSEGAGGPVRSALTLGDELWIFGAAGLRRLDAATGSLLGDAPDLTAGSALPLDDAARLWLRSLGTMVELREGPARSIGSRATRSIVRLAAASLTEPASRDALILDGEGLLTVLRRKNPLEEAWRVPHVADFCAGPLRPGESDVLVVLTRDGKIQAWGARGAKKGEWTPSLRPLLPPILADLDADGSLEVVLIGDSGVQGCHPVSGEILIEASHGYTMVPREVVLSDLQGDGMADLLLVSSSALDPCVLLPGRVLEWAVEIPGRSSSPSLVADVTRDGRPEVFYVGMDGLLLLDGASGNLLWKKPNPGLRAATAAAGKVGGVLLASRIEGIRCLAGSTGEPLWSARDVNGEVSALLADEDVSGDGEPDVVLVTFRRGAAPDDPSFTQVQCRDAAGGRSHWRVEFPGATLIPPVVRERRILVLNEQGVLRALLGGDGSTGWTIDFKERTTADLGWTPDGLRLVVPLESGRMALVIPREGRVDATWNDAGIQPASPCWIAPGGRTHAVWSWGAAPPSGSGMHVSCAPLPGAPRLWDRELASGVWTPPVALGEDRIVVTTQDHRLEVLDAASGRTLWSVDLGIAPSGSPIVRDLTGDGRPDIGVEIYGTFAVLRNADRPWTCRWAGPRGDRFGAGCVRN